MTRDKVTTDELREKIHQADTAWIQEVGSSYHPLSIADSLKDLDVSEIWSFLSKNDSKIAAAIFTEFDDETRELLIERLKLKDFVWILSAMSHDERADLVAKLPEELQRQVLPALPAGERDDIRKLAAYPEGTAGAIMTTDFTAIPVDYTVDEAIREIRRLAEWRETIYYVYVIDAERKLVGMCTLKNLILAKSGTSVEKVMHRDLVFGFVEEDQEEISGKISKYDILALPIIDHHHVLLGIVTYDDALDVVQQEQTEDFEKFMAITGRHGAEGYLRTPFWLHIKNRASWLVILAIMELGSGWILHTYQYALSRVIILALYLPMIADTGGNAGSQSATVIIRALTLREIYFSDLWRVLLKELQVSAGLALLLGFLAVGKVYFLSYGADLPLGLTLGGVSFAIGLALGIQVVTSTLLGACLPLIVSKLKLDPAVVASPAITTLVDITGISIYFFIATSMLDV